MKVSLSTLVELVGFVCLFVAAFAVDWRLGVALAGAACVSIGWVLGRAEEAAKIDEGGEP